MTRALVGLFPDATKDYARAIGERLDDVALIVPTTVDALNRASGRTLCEGADGCGPSNARLPTATSPIQPTWIGWQTRWD